MPVNSKHADYIRMQPRWTRCRDVAAGGDAVHAAGEKYLPRPALASDLDYARYKLRATFYNATWRTISGLTGMVFRKPATIETPTEMEDWLKNVDGGGKTLEVLQKECVEDNLKVDRIALLVDHPPTPPDATKAVAERLNLRPTIQVYRAESLINWDVGMVNNQIVVTLAVLLEYAKVPIDRYAHTNEERWRVLELVDAQAENGVERKVYRQQVWKMKSNASAGQEEFEQVGEDIFPQQNGKTMDFIPLVVISCGKVSLEVEEPNLIDLVDMNLSHYRTNAIYERCVAFCPPTLMLTGFKKEKETDVVYVGSETAIIQSSPDANGRFIEYTGAALGPLENALDRKEKQMAILGARMLEPQRAQVESADGQSIHRKGEESMLASLAGGVSEGITKALRWMAEWGGLPSDKIKCELNRDFFSAPMDPGLITALVAGWQAGAPGLSDQGLFRLLKEGELVDEDVTLEDELHRIKMQPPRLGTVPGGPEPDDDEGMPKKKMAAPPANKMRMRGKMMQP